MCSRIFLGVLGLSGGIVIAGGLVALIMELKIIPRYAGITHTANRIKLYENCIIAGAIIGNLMTVYPIELHWGQWFLYPLGLFGGIFLGSWIIALTEVLDIVPIMSRRAGLKRGFAAIIIATALGKVLATLVFDYYRW